jgi:hypothetical protein
MIYERLRKERELIDENQSSFELRLNRLRNECLNFGTDPYERSKQSMKNYENEMKKKYKR